MVVIFLINISIQDKINEQAKQFSATAVNLFKLKFKWVYANTEAYD